MKNSNVKRKSGMVKLRGGFSDKNGLININKIQQIDEFDDDTRTRLNNTLFSMMVDAFENNDKYFYYNVDRDDIRKLGHYFSRDLLYEVFCQDNRIDKDFIYNWRVVYKKIIDVIIDATYNEVLDIVQYSCRWIENVIQQKKGSFFNKLNAFFEEEYVGYQFVGGYIVAITDEIELKEIFEACNNPYEGAQSHLKKAVQFLADRTKKDYKNCIKESISAVESICQIITGDDKATLSEALKIISKGNTMPSALNQGFNKLYGYTSNQGGIRHAEGLFESNVSFDEAKYFLVSCSAFVNYLIAEYAKGSN